VFEITTEPNGRREGRNARSWILAGLFFLFSFPGLTQEPGILTLPEAMRKVSRGSVQADTARIDRSIAREDSVQVSTLYTPQVTFEGGHLNLDNAPFFVNGPVVFPAGEKQSWHYKLDARYLLWDGGRRSAALEGSRFREMAVDLRGSDSVRRAQAEVAARYAALLTVKAQKRVVAQRRESLGEHLRTVQDLFENGVVARNDLLRTEVSLRSVGDSDGALDDAYANALEALNVAMGLDPATPQQIPGSLPPAPPVPWDEEECRRLGAVHNGSVLAMEAKIQALAQQLQARKRDYYPSLIAEVSHAYDQNKYMLHPWVTSFFVGLSVNVFDGGERASKIRQASLEMDRATREYAEARRASEASAALALREFRQALREAETARANVAASEENLRIVQDQYREGIARNADVLDAEQVLAESRFSLAQKDLQAYARQAALLAALGEDLVAFYAGLDTPERSMEN
jgi:outer membrane protein TolC